MLPKEFYIAQIEKEFSTARKALSEGNAGKVRVCARRAAGQAIAWFLSKNPKAGWGADAMSQLSGLKLDACFPEEVREAAARLTMKMTDQFTYPSSTDPIRDSTTIVDYIKHVMESDVS
jgi:hypothetical protein